MRIIQEIFRKSWQKSPKGAAGSELFSGREMLYYISKLNFDLIFTGRTFYAKET